MRLDDVASATEFLFRSSNRCPVLEQLWKTVAKRYAATSRFFWGVTLSGMMRLGPLAPPPEQRVVPSPQPVAVTLRAGCHRATVVSMRDHVPAKCEAAHTSFPFSPSKVQQGDIYLARQEGTHGTKTKTSSVRIYGRDGSCNGVDYPSGHDVGGPRFGCAELVSDVPSSTSAFVVRGAQAAPRIERRARLAHAYDRAGRFVRSIGSAATK